LFLQRIEGLYENAEKLELFKHMTLSQIIAKDSTYDIRIPVQGQFSIRIEIKDGNVVFLKKEEKIKKVQKEIRL